MLYRTSPALEIYMYSKSSKGLPSKSSNKVSGFGLIHCFHCFLNYISQPSSVFDYDHTMCPPETNVETRGQKRNRSTKRLRTVYRILIRHVYFCPVKHLYVTEGTKMAKSE